MPFLKFMSDGAGRAVRIVAGLALIAVGAILGGAFRALAVVGLVPLLAGVFDVCLFAPLARMPFAGKAFRAKADRPTGGDWSVRA
ncbi:MAG: DUF2892 domain-containing protein [Actinomycetota bacterium]|nr:DUF2892 domain-containing protein [Actinomycetota bacterium]